MKMFGADKAVDFELEVIINLEIRAALERSPGESQIIQMHSHERMSEEPIEDQYYGYMTLPFEKNGDLLQFLMKQRD